MKTFATVVLFAALALPATSRAVDIKQSKFTQVVNSVQVVSAADQSQHDATVNSIFKLPDLLRTGPDSRAEMIADDNTITRVGANTVFSYNPANRTINLEKGSLLFHAPHGKGGGTIHTASATASVLGTTIIVTTTPNGGFKLLTLEGQAEVKFLNGLKEKLSPGQMTFILPGGNPAPIVIFRLDEQTKHSALVSGFTAPLPSLDRINSAINGQLSGILNNDLEDTGLLIGDDATPNEVQVLANVTDQNQPNTQPTVPAEFGKDASVIAGVSASGLPVNYPDLDPAHLNVVPFDTTLLPNADLMNVFPFLTAAGFLGNNIDIDTPTIDMSPFAGMSGFDFMAAKDMRIWQSLTFNGGAAPSFRTHEVVILPGMLPNSISLDAGGSLSIAQGATIEADTGLLWLGAQNFNTMDGVDGNLLFANTLDNVCIQNAVGDIDLYNPYAGSGITLQNGSMISAGGLASVQSDGDITINDTSSVNAGGNVNIHSGKTLTFNNAGGTPVTAGGSVTLGGDSGVALSGSTVTAGASLGLNTFNDMNIAGSTLNANDATLTAGANMDIGLGSAINTTADINLNNGTGTLTVGGLSGAVLTAGGAIQASSLGDMKIYNSSQLNANGGNIGLTAAGNVDIDASSLAASGSINLSSSSDVTIDNTSHLTANGGDITVSAAGDIGVDSGTVDALAGNISLSSLNGGVTLDSLASFSADSGVTLTAGQGDVNVLNTTTFAVNNGDVTVSAAGNIDIAGSTLNVGIGNISLNANGHQILNNSPGPVNIFGATFDLGGNVTVDTSTVNAQNDVTISSGGTLNINSAATATVDSSTIVGNNIWVTGSSISAANGNFNIVNNGSVMVSGDGSSSVANSTIDVNNITIDNSTITAGGNISILNKGVLSLPGISGSTIIANNFSIIDSSLQALSGSVTIQADALLKFNSGVNALGVDISAGGPVNLTSVHGGADLNDTTVSTITGDINLTTAQDVNFTQSSLFTVSGNINVSSGGALNMTPSGAGINAFGDVNLEAVNDVNLDLAQGAVDAGGNVNVTSDTGSLLAVNGTISAAAGDVNLSAAAGPVSLSGATVSALNNVSVTAGNGLDINGTSISGNAGSGVIDIKNNAGMATVYGGSSLQAFWIKVNSPGGILLDGTQGGSISGNKLDLVAANTAGHNVTLQNENLSAFSTVNIAGHTVTLFNVSFGAGSIGNFGSFYGGFYVNPGTSQAGYVNFINTSYGGVPIVTSIGGLNPSDTIVDLVAGPVGVAGLHVYKNP